ncbi:MAG TPA: hypothetical protein VFE33_03860 [Thermoanaerobaculia bacterium]|nr:hypothetical protein [Thermoanaerobaculia bacterium]
MLPIEPLLRRAVGADPQDARQAWTILGLMARRDRPEAGIFLLGLLQVHQHDLAQMTALIDAVALVPSAAAAEALKNEFLRVPSSRSTRTYLNEVLRAITHLSPPWVDQALSGLMDDKRLSPKWRRRAEEVAWRLNL